MVDVISIIVAVIAAIIAIVALVLVFVLPGPSGATGPTGSSNMTGFAKIVGNGIGTYTNASAKVATFTPAQPITVRQIYSNATDLFNMVYTPSNGIFTVAAGGGGYYQISSDNLLQVDLTKSDTGNTDVFINLLVNTVNVAQSTSRVYFETGAQNSLLMLNLNWQGTLAPGDNIAIDVVISSAYTGSMSYGFPNNTRLMLNGITKYA